MEANFVKQLKNKVMDVITIESAAYKELTENITKFERFIEDTTRVQDDLDTMWVDSNTVCEYLHISDRTLQRLRSQRMIAYSSLGGKIYYTLGEIKRALDQRMIRRKEDQLDALVTCYKNNIRKLSNR